MNRLEGNRAMNYFKPVIHLNYSGCKPGCGSCFLFFRRRADFAGENDRSVYILDPDMLSIHRGAAEECIFNFFADIFFCHFRDDADVIDDAANPENIFCYTSRMAMAMQASSLVTAAGLTL